MAVSPAPNRAKKETPQADNEALISSIINNGGKPLDKPADKKATKASSTTRRKSKNADKGVKGITLLLTFEEADIINQLRNLRPVARGRKKAISLHDWLLEATQEKIDKEKRKYDI